MLHCGPISQRNALIFAFLDLTPRCFNEVKDQLKNAGLATNIGHYVSIDHFAFDISLEISGAANSKTRQARHESTHDHFDI